MRYLFDRMNPGIGASSTYQFDWVVSDESERSFDMLLHRLAMWLALPAAVSCS
jgi:radical SAM superfamily enzyme YgiQ (UPF0313 family)